MRIFVFRLIIFHVILTLAKSNQIIFNCDFSSSSCTGKPNVEITNRENAISNISNYKLNYKTTVTTLKVRNCLMNFLPQGFDKFFDSIKILEIKNTHLIEITKFDLKQFCELEELSIIFNDLTTIDGDLFDNHQQMKFLDLRFNKIFSIPNEVYQKFQSNLKIQGNLLGVPSPELKSNETDNLQKQISELQLSSYIIAGVTLFNTILCIISIIMIIKFKKEYFNFNFVSNDEYVAPIINGQT
ncbi:hypothetical protein PVAND_015182 [Polypedilum vanderplanki]|uniref:Uncharacterized protein n=1 Tax=Polypedilum vanderplanki TaxID=319348 RepID=A0A9J6BCB2_POLVA|nr:hypothetical protein PVAND_015182 [Polypedilum vanderplanki]